jgi:thioredoxin 2
MRATIVVCPNCGKNNRVPPAATGSPRCGNCHAQLPWVVDADRDSFRAEITAGVPVVIDFWAPWCAPCRMVSPVLEKLARDLAGQLKVVKLNVDEATDVAARYGAQSIPLLVLVRDGAEVDRLVGAVPEPGMRGWIEPHLDAAAAAPPS